MWNWCGNTTNVTISISILLTFRSWVATPHPRQPIVFFISQLIRHARARSSYECFILRAVRLSNKLLGGRDMSRNVWNRLWGSSMVGIGILPNNMRFPYLEDDHTQWHPPLMRHYTNFFYPLRIWTLLPNLTFYLIVWVFLKTFSTGAACQQRTLTPPDTLSCPTFEFACVLMSRPISPELVLFLDFWISNIP